MTLKLNGTNSEAAPAYAGDDADTGLQCGTDELKLVTGGTARATIDSDGDLGIGTASPSALLHIAKSGGNAKLLIQRSNTAANTNDYGSILWQSSAGNNNALIGAARHSAENDAYMFFSTASGGSLAEGMRLDSSGRLGIASTSPDAELHVGGSEPHIDIGPDDSNRGKIGYKSNDLFFGTSSSSGEFIFKNNVSSTDNPADSGTERMRMTSGGCLLINGTSVVTRSQTVNFQVGEGSNSFGIQRANSVNVVEVITEVGTTTGRTIQAFKNPNGVVGGISISGSATTFETSSDYRLKENIVDLADGIDRVKQLLPRRFNFIADADKTVDGFIAHEAQAVVPEAVRGTHNEVDDDGNAVMQGIDQSKLVPLLTAALQEAIAKIETLETKVAALEAA